MPYAPPPVRLPRRRLVVICLALLSLLLAGAGVLVLARTPGALAEPGADPVTVYAPADVSACQWNGSLCTPADGVELTLDDTYTASSMHVSLEVGSTHKIVAPFYPSAVAPDGAAQVPLRFCAFIGHPSLSVVNFTVSERGEDYQALYVPQGDPCPGA